MSPTAERLAALAAQLGESPAQVAGVLCGELTRALGELDAGLARGDSDQVAQAAHAARNSVLMLDAPELLAGLRGLDAALRAGDREAAGAVRAELQVRWDGLRDELQAAQAAGEPGAGGSPGA